MSQPHSRKCRTCKETKLITEFSLRSDTGKYRTDCKGCRNTYNLKLYHTNSKQKENHRRASWKHSIKKNYSVEIEDYYKMLDKQEGRCKICNTHIDNLPYSVLYIDHCHTTMKVRGLLCNACNTGLGMFRDRQDLLLKAIGYLDENTSS